jgi:signal transduction histidine kinase
MNEPKVLSFKPYARLLTMLGDQLIKNERIALVEIIKNSYDADATWVKVIFEGFSANFEATASSKIIIEDDGVGMTRDVIENHWVNPATPVKLIRKQSSDRTAKGRVIQGEKGIGRFALLKLGRTITIVTRPKGKKSEYTLKLDLAGYNSDFISDTGGALFLDQISMTLRETEQPQHITGGSVQLGARVAERARHGTRIEITHLESPWSRAKVEKVYGDLVRLQSIFDPNLDQSDDDARVSRDQFDVSIFRDRIFEPFSEQYKQRLETLIRQNSVFRVEDGRYDEKSLEFSFTLNGTPVSLTLRDPDLTGLTLFRKYFGEKGEKLSSQGTSCGSFSFAFYIFDFSADAKGSHHLDSEERQLIKEHRIYLYRDGIRVYPYGDPEDDWLGIDIYRGTIRASELLSNDQVVGYASITQADNPKLQDKTNREGLIDQGDATSDFVQLLRLVLAWIRKKPYGQYRASLGTAREVEVFKGQKVQQAIDNATKSPTITPDAKEQLANINKLYQAERKYLVKRAETTEHLAGVGLSVETASHDLMSAMQRALALLDTLITQTRRSGELNKDAVFSELNSIRGMLSFIQQQIKDLQLLFKSTKQRRKDIKIKEVLEKVLRLFAPALDKDSIKVSIEETKSPLVAKTTDAVLLQLFLNLFDNSIYWLKTASCDREIVITLNGDDGNLIFSDNGPGISRDDAAYIFEPFYSGKGEDGRGLGLYIARQLLERHEYGIELADLSSQKRLSGANFVVSFLREEK